jgi:hypothetical protein
MIFRGQEPLPEACRHKNPGTACRRYYLSEKTHLLRWPGNRRKPELLGKRNEGRTWKEDVFFGKGLNKKAAKIAA